MYNADNSGELMGILVSAIRSGLPAGMLRSIEEYIDVHLEQDLSVEQLASHLGISPSYFARSFRSSVGLAPHSYVMRRRLSRAQELLASTELPLIDIALATNVSPSTSIVLVF
jgi:AraC family transcriptional regulator